MLNVKYTAVSNDFENRYPTEITNVTLNKPILKCIWKYLVLNYTNW